MKILTIHIDDDLDVDLSKGATAADASKSAFVRNAIREKLARDVYGIVDVPTLAAARKNIVQMPQPDALLKAASPGKARFEELKAQAAMKRNGVKAA